MDRKLTALRYSQPAPDWQARSHVILHEVRQEIAATLELTHTSAWPEVINTAIMTHGGSLTAASQTGWGPHWCELSLLQITGTGDTFEESAREWAKCARRSALEQREAA